MKKLLRSRTTRKFLAPDGSWTREIQQARVFRSDGDAVDLCGGLDPKNLQLYYSFNEETCSKSDFTVPLG